MVELHHSLAKQIQENESVFSILFSRYQDKKENLNNIFVPKLFANSSYLKEIHSYFSLDLSSVLENEDKYKLNFKDLGI